MVRKFDSAFSYYFAAASLALSRVPSRDIEIFVYDTASIRCSSNESTDIQWHFNTDIHYIYAGGKFSPTYKGRFRLEKNVTTRDFDLIISNVTLEDAGMYLCQDELNGRRLSSTQLIVLYVNPVCSSNMPSDGFVGPNTCDLQREKMTISCDVAFNGRPPYVIWRSADVSQKFCSSSCEVKLNRSICNLTFEADSSYDGSVFICDAITPSGRRFSCNSEMIKVWYLLADYENAEKKIKGSASCAVRSNLNVQYKWILEQNSKRMLLSANQTISFQQSGIHHCKVDYIIRNTTCSTLVLNVTVDADIQEEQSITTLLVIVLMISLLVVIAIVSLVIYRLKRRPLLPVRVTLETNNQQQAKVVEEFNNLLKQLQEVDGSAEQTNRLISAKQLKIIAVNRGP